MLSQATISKADDQDQAVDEVEYSSTLDAEDAATFKAAGWNRWTCIAKRTFILRMYRGSSFYFRPQSGEGQGAKLVAQKIALRACEFSTNATCTSNLSDCTVETY